MKCLMCPPFSASGPVIALNRIMNHCYDQAITEYFNMSKLYMSNTSKLLLKYMDDGTCKNNSTS